MTRLRSLFIIAPFAYRIALSVLCRRDTHEIGILRYTYSLRNTVCTVQTYHRSHESLAGCPSTICRGQFKDLMTHSSSDEAGDDEDEEGERAAVVVGRHFEVHQHVYAVQAIEGTKVSAKVVWPLHQNGFVDFEIDNAAT